MYDLTVDRNSVLVVAITPTAEETPWEGSYEVALVPDYKQPTDADWQQPDVDGDNSGAWIGPGTARVQRRSDILQAWWRPIGTTEIPWTRVYPRIRIT